MKEAEIFNFLIQNKEVIAASLIVFAALTQNQVRAIKQRDYNRCEAPFPHKHSGRLNVHHIQPQHYTHGQGADFGDFPENVLTICEGAHRAIHGDLQTTYDEYRRGDKEAFKKMAQRHKISGEKGEIDWNDRWDHQMLARARKNTIEAQTKRGWFFPPRRSDK